MAARWRMRCLLMIATAAGLIGVGIVGAWARSYRVRDTWMGPGRQLTVSLNWGRINFGYVNVAYWRMPPHGVKPAQWFDLRHPPAVEGAWEIGCRGAHLAAYTVRPGMPRTSVKVTTTFTSGELSLGVPLVLVGMVAGWCVWKLRRLRGDREGCCAGCGYDLRASAGRCPECGRLIEAGRGAADHPPEPSVPLLMGGGEGRG